MKIGLIQMTSGPDIADNLAYLEDRIREAAGQGAELVATPENSDFMVEGQDQKLALSYAESHHPFLSRLCYLARELKVSILLGSLSIKLSDTHLANRSYVIDENGQITAQYDKIHLFDAVLPTGEIYCESKMVRPGDKAVVASSACGAIGITICYDLRFPHLYRALAKAGATVLAVPAAFTVPTGDMHWEVLLRARAIENGTFVIAAAQCGVHDGGRKTYGHSMVIDPWGHIIAEAGNDPCILYADINLDEVSRFRQAIPSLTHDRAFSVETEDM